MVWLLDEPGEFEAVATTVGVESPLSTVAGQEKVPPEQSQFSMEEGDAVVRVMSTSRLSGVQVPLKVTESPEEKKPGSFRVTVPEADSLPQPKTDPNGEMPPCWPQDGMVTAPLASNKHRKSFPIRIFFGGYGCSFIFQI